MTAPLPSQEIGYTLEYSEETGECEVTIGYDGDFEIDLSGNELSDILIRNALKAISPADQAENACRKNYRLVLREK